MIVQRADMFGLSQLYQLRGRIGRSKQRAYAYLTTPPDKKLTETADAAAGSAAVARPVGRGLLGRQP